jgi:Subtilase family
MLNDPTRTLFAFRKLVLIAMCAALAACSGGGGGGGGGASLPEANSTTIYTASGTNIIAKFIRYYVDGSQTVTTENVATEGPITVAQDHVTANGIFKTSSVGGSSILVEPSVSTAPTLTGAVYPSNWTSGGTVTPPHTSTATGTYFDGAPYTADGSEAHPFRQATLTPNGPTGAGAINDPNAFVLIDNPSFYTFYPRSFDLRWGTPDPAGPGYVTTWYGASGTASSYTYPSAIMIAGRTVSGQSSTSSGITLGTPVPDVKAAWSQGWTGQGQNILMIDGYPNPDGSTKPSSWTQDKFTEWYTHGITTYLLASRYAPAASMYVIDGNGLFDQKIHLPTDNSVPVFQTNAHGNLANSVRSSPGFYFDVVNISLGYNYWERNITNPTSAQVNAAFADQQSWVDYMVKSINGTYSSGGNSLGYGANGSAAIYLTDAVITKSAGNDSISTANDPLSYALANDSGIRSRLLLVGALDGYGQTNPATGHGTATIASYSNTAGNNVNIQLRFLVASGGSPYSDTGLAINGTNVSSSTGTSYAAPRVAGYAAIVRQKFPNLTAANTADILLATARYDTLKCYPNCDKAIYGQGEASLSRALAPVGYLR